MIGMNKICFFIPPGLKKFKLELFERIGKKIKAGGGIIVRNEFESLRSVPKDIIPVVGCSPELTPLIKDWQQDGRNWIYWDRGYVRRVFACWLPKGDAGGYYRWHINSFQLSRICGDNISGKRWDALKVPLSPWQKKGRHVVVALPTPTYSRFHQITDWTQRTLDALALVTDRQIVVRGKESKRSLQSDLEGAHCLISHGSVAAVEAVILGCPVFVDKSSAAALVGLTDLKDIERPIYPDREKWAWSLANSQWNEEELVNGTLWNQISCWSMFMLPQINQYCECLL